MKLGKALRWHVVFYYLLTICLLLSLSSLAYFLLGSHVETGYLLHLGERGRGQLRERRPDRARRHHVGV